MNELGAALVVAEDRLRAHGLTGGQAFDALLAALEERLGVARDDPGPVARAIAADVPLAPGSDLFGLAYERFFPDLFKGLRGQFFTPPPVARLLVSGLPAGTTLLDPTAGSGGLLIAGASRARDLRGIELDPRLARLATLNLRLAGVGGEVRCADFFLADPDPVDAVIANPPFSVAITDRARLDRYELGRGRARVRSDHLFVEALERWVSPGGWAAVVLPFTIVANRVGEVLRQRIDAGWVRRGICALPEGVFRPFGGAAGRAVLLWLQRAASGAAEAPCRWAELRDPGYDVRGKQIRATSSAEVDALVEGVGWCELPAGAWSPPRARSGVPVGSLARWRREGRSDGVQGAKVADLADADRATGELLPREPVGDERSARIRLVPGDVVVARLRPNLGNVARVPPGEDLVVGSPEWVPLEPVAHGGWLLHALRTPTWRGSLPIASGQTRPRTTPQDVLASTVPWPGEALAARVDALSSRLLSERARLRAEVEALQRAVDAFAAGEVDEEGLRAALDALDRRS
jgi:hypothetical protein